MRQAGITVLFVEHDMEIVERYVTRVLAFREGRIIADRPPAEVMNDPAVADTVTGHAIRGHRPSCSDGGGSVLEPTSGAVPSR